MDRRSFLQAAAVTGAALALPGCTSTPAAGRTTASGPGRAAWAALEHGLAGDLLRPGEPGFDRAKRLYDPRFDRVAPTAVVRVATAQDVAETIRFARRHDLDLRPRSGGHSYVGASTARGGIQLDLRGMDRVVHDGADDTVRVQAGARLFDIHTALEDAGRTLPSGTCPTVGVAGLTLGGGVGVESRMSGLTCDALDEVVLVTASGHVRHVGADRNPDLFWACRGGGGGSFGVVTAMTFRTFPAHEMGFFFLRFSSGDAEAVVRGWHRRVAVMPRTSWANVHLDALADGSLDVRVVGLSFTGEGHPEGAAMVAAIGREPTRSTFFTRSHHDGVRLLAGCSTLSDEECSPAPGGALGRESFVAGSDVLAGRLGPHRTDAVVAHLRARAGSGQSGTLILDPLGGRVARPARGATAFAWRTADAIAQWYVPMPSHPTRTATAAAYRWIGHGHRAFGGASVGGYVNYLEPGRPLHDYYGRNFARLRAVKARYDPDDLFGSRYSVPLP